MIRTCGQCGREFEKRNTRILCCSRSCAAKSRWDRRGRAETDVRACEWCGEEFTAFKRDAKRFCSHRCVSFWVATKRDMTGPRNPRFNGGLCTHKGRTMVCCRDGSTLWYSRALMASHLGRLLRPDEIVHHINGDGSDDRIENFEITTRSEHINMHRTELLAGRKRAA